MTASASARLAWAMFLATAALGVVQAVLVLSGSVPLVDPVAGPDPFPIITAGAVLSSLVGALVVTRHPRNPIGWLFLAGQLGLAIGLVCQAFSHRVLTDGAFAPRPVGQVSELVSTTFDAKWTLSVLAAALLLFPDGRLPSRRWRPVLWAVPVAEILVVVSVLMTSLDTLASGGTSPKPLAVSLLDPISGTLSGLVLLLTVVSLFVRRRRASRLQRQQLRWLTVATVGLLVGFAVGDLSPWAKVVLFLAYAAVPIAAGIAILKYRLYDIDLVINRAVAGAALVVFTTVGYVVVVVLVGALVGDRMSDRYGISVFATAVVALAFQPVRGKVQRLSDRVVYGRRAAPYRALADLSRQLAHSLSPQDILPVVAEATMVGLAAAQVTVRLEVPGGEDVIVRRPDGVPSEEVDATVAVWHHAERLGEIAVTVPRGRRMSTLDRNLLADIATQAGLGFHNTRLAASLAAGIEQVAEQAVQLEASRRRLLAAQESGRQRVGRAVRTEILPHLEAVRAELDRVLRTACDGAIPIERAGERVVQALEALREIARGVYPPVLARSGLVEALSDYASRHPHRLALTVTNTLRSRPLSRRAQATAYFCAVESVRELGPSVIDLDADGDDLVLEVAGHDATATLADEGRGLMDRAEACGGEARWDRDPAGRPRLRVTLPLDTVDLAGPVPDQPDQPAAAHTARSAAGPKSALEM